MVPRLTTHFGGPSVCAVFRMPGRHGAEWVRRLAVALLACLSLLCSLIESKVNVDWFHWGLVYSSSVDLLHGLRPFSETYEIYGLFGSYVQAAGLLVFGRSLTSLGVSTGIFHATNLVLSYFVLKTFLKPNLALLAVGIAFLFHPYINYPWSSYVAYSLWLAAILVFLSRPTRVGYALAGALMSLAVLSRYTFAIPIAGTFAVYWTVSLSSPLRRRNVPAEIGWVMAGAAPIVGVFGALLAVRWSFHDFWSLTYTVNHALANAIQRWQSLHSPTKFLVTLLRNMYLYWLQGTSGIPRLVGISLAAVGSTFAVVGLALRNLLYRQFGDPAGRGRAALLVGSAGLFGFSQALHSYEAFRLGAAATISFGSLLWAIDVLAARSRYLSFLDWLPCACGLALALLLGRNFIAMNKSPVSVAWPADVWQRLRRPQKAPALVPILEGKWCPAATQKLYADRQTLMKRLHRCPQKTLINTGLDPLALYLEEGFQKAQREPCRTPWHISDAIFPDEVERRQELLRKRDAIVVMGKSQVLPEGYQAVFRDRDSMIAVPASCAATM